MVKQSALRARDITRNQPAESAELIDLGAWWESPTRKTARTLKPRTWLTQTKFALPAIGLGLILIAFLWPAFMPAMPNVQATLEKLRPGVAEELAMFDLNYKGTNKEGAPFAVEAVKAVRSGSDSVDPEITLTTPQADLVTKAGNFVAVKSETGVYDEKAQALQMRGDVEILHDNGTTFSAPFLDVDFATNSARTTQPVAVHGDFGQIHAPGMVLEDGGDRVIFTGTPEARAHAVIKAAPKGGLTPANATVAPEALPLAEPKAPPTLD